MPHCRVRIHLPSSRPPPMSLRRTTRFVAFKTLPTLLFCGHGQSYVPCRLLLSRATYTAGRVQLLAGAAAPSSRPSTNLRPDTGTRSSTSLNGARKTRGPMIGPELPPAPPPPPIFDADGNELSKPTKRKVAIVVGYVGTAFHGWQQSTDAQNVRTVEGELETALWKAGAIADSNYGDLNKIGWGRTSRTDKGVHASKTVAAAKLLLPQETFTTAGMSQYGKDKLNEHLPDDIRCFSVSKVPKSFRGREECTLREYTYYLPKHLLPDDEALEKFRGLLTLFVGTHSFHNYASTKGRQLKEVRKRVQASIDFKKAGGKAPAEGEKATAPGSDAVAAGDAGGAGGSGKKRWLSKEEWRTFRHKKKSAVDQKADDAWFGKPGAEASEGTAAAAEAPGAEGISAGSSGDAQALEAAGAVNDGLENPGKEVQELRTPQDDAPTNAGENTGADEAVAATAMDVASAAGTSLVGDGDGGKAEGGAADGKGGVGADASTGAEAAKGTESGGEGAKDEGPEKQIMLRELRTSIYRCEALDGIVSYKRPGQDTPDEFVRIDIRGKAFVYNQIRLMIGGALGEARGDLMPGFVEAALKTPYKLRVPLAPAEGLVLESQAFTRHTNALVLDPRDLASVGGTLAVWGETKEGNGMQGTGRLQTLLTLDQLRESERWNDEHILPAVAEAWETRGTAKLFLDAVGKFFVGQQQEEPLLEAISQSLSEISEGERRAEEKYNKFRVLAKEKGSTKYKELLPKSIATGIVCKFRLLPGNKVSAIQRGVVKRMDEGELPPLAEVEEILEFIEKIGVDRVAQDGGFVAPDVEDAGAGGEGGGSSGTSSGAAAVVVKGGAPLPTAAAAAGVVAAS